ncbi:MAG: glucose 1-dehydrogenase [Chloroflexi bacterium]|nr:glucose 1-dehydrogenase [Chloroflexota bacterium]
MDASAPTGRLSGHVAFVTGGGSGIGRAVCVRLARECASVAVVDVVADAAEATAALLREDGAAVIPITADVASRESVEAAVDEAWQRLGPIDILVNNAGIMGYRPFLRLTDADWDRTMAVNAKGVFLCSQAVARRLSKAHLPGTIINMSSIVSEVAIEFQAHYAASKGAVRMLTRAMALELAAHDITVNAVAPGVVETAMTADLLADPAVAEVTLPLIPLGRAAKPEEVAATVAFLASADARYLTGTSVTVDGGYLLR